MPPTPRWLDLYVKAINSPGVRRFTTALAAGLLRARHRISRRTWKRIFQLVYSPCGCCEPDGVHDRLTHRFQSLLRRPGVWSRLEEWWESGDLVRHAARFEALARVVLLGALRRHVLLGRAEPSTVLYEGQLALNPECPLPCAGCYSQEDRSGRAPDREQLAWLVDELASCGALAVYLVGKGEPLLHAHEVDDLLAVIAARPHLLFVLPTSGITLTEALAARLAALPNLLVLVSVEGPREVHDARRGRGMYDRALRALAFLRAHGAVFGFACMIARSNYRAIADPGFLRAMARAGCALGVASRYFPLSADARDDLAFEPARLADYRRRLDVLHEESPIPFADLDDLESHSGCRSRAGLSVYIDGTTGVVSPCIRTPFAPPGCRLDRARGVGLTQVLARPFFGRYRAGADPGRVWCGADLSGELGALSAELSACGTRSEALEAYRERASATVETACAARES